MNFLPTPPTDNLYKFSAISGLLLSILSIFGFVFFIYLGVHMDEAGKLQVYSYSAEKTLKEVNCRLEALKAGMFDKCPRSTSVYPEDPTKEIPILEHIQEVQQELVDKYNMHKEIAKPIYDNIDWVVESKIHCFVSAIPALSLALFLFGFSKWFSKVQRPADELTKLNLQIKKLEISKLESELKDIEKKKAPRFSERRL